MKLIYLIIATLIVILGIFHITLDEKPEASIILHTGFQECKLELNYEIDSTFNEEEVYIITNAFEEWIIASGGELCFVLYTRDIKWYEYFLGCDEPTIYNTQGGIWQQAGIYLNPLCQRIGCVGLAFNTGNIFLTDRGILYLIALHEIGHTLGLRHSPNHDDIMYPYIGATKISPEDARVLGCLILQDPPLMWGDTKCSYNKVGRKNE